MTNSTQVCLSVLSSGGERCPKSPVLSQLLHLDASKELTGITRCYIYAWGRLINPVEVNRQSYRDVTAIVCEKSPLMAQKGDA